MNTNLEHPYNRRQMFLGGIADITDGIPDTRYDRDELYYAAIYNRVKGMDEDIDVLERKVDAMGTDMKYKGSVEDYEHLPTNAKKGDLYTTLDSGKEYVYDGTEWVEIGAGASFNYIHEEHIDDANVDMVTIGDIDIFEGTGKGFAWFKSNEEDYAATMIGSLDSSEPGIKLSDGEVNIYNGGKSRIKVQNDRTYIADTENDYGLMVDVDGNDNTKAYYTKPGETLANSEIVTKGDLDSAVGNIYTLLANLISGGGAE